MAVGAGCGVVPQAKNEDLWDYKRLECTLLAPKIRPTIIGMVGEEPKALPILYISG